MKPLGMILNRVQDTIRTPSYELVWERTDSPVMAVANRTQIDFLDQFRGVLRWWDARL